MRAMRAEWSRESSRVMLKSYGNGYEMSMGGLYFHGTRRGASGRRRPPPTHLLRGKLQFPNRSPAHSPFTLPAPLLLSNHHPIITRSSPITAMDPSSKHLPSSLPLSQRKSKTPPPPTGVGSSVYLPYPQKFSCRDERFYRLNSNFPDGTSDGTPVGTRRDGA